MPMQLRHFRSFAFVFGLPAQQQAQAEKMPALRKPNGKRKARDDRRKLST